jgi:hypothetical protein
VPLRLVEDGGDGRLLVARTAEPVKALNELTEWALRRGVDLPGLQVGAPSLEDVYLEVTAEDGGEV